MQKPFLKYITALLLFGINGIIASKISLSSYEIVLMRTLMGSAFLLIVFLAGKNRFTFTKHKRDMLLIAVSGVAMGTSWMFLYEAFSQLGVSMASLLYYTGPVIVMALSPLMFKESLSIFKVTGFVSVLAGVLLVNGKIGGNTNIFGILCGLLSAVTYAVMVISNKINKHIHGLENSLLQLIVSFFTVAVFVGIKTGFSINVPQSEWGWILILGVLNTGIGCYLFFSSIGKLPVQVVAVCGYLEPLSAVAFSFLILKETMSPLQIIGAVLIIGGAMFSEIKFNSKRHPLEK